MRTVGVLVCATTRTYVTTPRMLRCSLPPNFIEESRTIAVRVDTDLYNTSSVQPCMLDFAYMDYDDQAAHHE